MKPTLIEARAIVREAFRIWSARGARFLAAAVAFYTLLAAAPLCLAILDVLGFLLGGERAQGALWGGLEFWVAPEGLATARSLTDHFARAQADEGALALVVLLYGSTRLFRALRRALNQLWGVDLESVEGDRSSAHRYGIRYGGALALVTLLITLVAVLSALKTAIALVPVTSIVWALDGGVSIGLAFVLFLALFRFLPETEVGWRDAAASALVTTVLFAIGSGLVTTYVHRRHTSDLYEGAGAVVVAMLWVYYSAQVFFFGACVGAVMHRRRRGPAP